MQKPIQISFRGLPVSDEIEAACHAEAEKLERVYDRITRCRIVVEAPQARHEKGDHYVVKVDLDVPGTEIVVNRNPPKHSENEDVHLALRDAFDAARRRLEDYVRKRRNHHPRG